MSHVIPDPLDDSIPLSGRESSHLPEHPLKAEETHLIDDRQIAITTVRATDLTLGLRRIPVGFYVTVQIDGAQWQTANKPVHVDLDVIEWDEQIVLPRQPSCKVTLSVHASFELGSMLGHGDILRKFEICVADLLDRSENSRPIVFQPKEGVVVSPCTSLFVKVERQLSCEPDMGILCPITVSTPHDMRDVMLMTDAGHCTLGRYYRTQNCMDLDQSIKHFECARDLCPNDHPCRSAALFNLATANFISWQVNGKYFDLDTAISLFQGALDLRPIGHPDRPATQLHLAIAFLSRFVKCGLKTDGDIAKTLLNEAPDACHAKRYFYRSALLALNTFMQAARSANANDLRVEGPTSRMLLLSPGELASRGDLCNQSNDPHALDEVISLHHEALKYYSTAHAQYEQLLCNLGAALHVRFERQGIPHDLDEAIAFGWQALDLRPAGHPDRCYSLNALANALYTSFAHRGHYEDLDKAIKFYRQALDMQPIGHPKRYVTLNNLASALARSFEHRGHYEDFEEMITFQRQVLDLLPVGHPDRSSSLNNLAITLHTTFEHRRNHEDLAEAITFFKQALDLTPIGHPDRPSSLNHLANALHTSFTHRGNDEDLDEAITFHRQSLDLQPIGYPHRCSSLDGLATTLHTSFKHQCNLPRKYEDLDEAIIFYRQALDLRPVGHPRRCDSLHNLANALSVRFKHRGNDKDLDEALANACLALSLVGTHHPHQSNIHGKISAIYVLYHESRLHSTGKDANNLDAAMAHLKAASGSVPSGLLSRLRMSLRWVSIASQYMHTTLLEAYTTSMQLLDSYMSTTALVSSRHHTMKDFPPTLAVDAASCALQGGDECRAVELLEQGRTIIWTQMARFRMPLDDLRERGDHAEALVTKFQELSHLLDRPPVEHPAGTPRIKVEAEATRYTRLVDEWSNVVEEIRKLEGFSRFLLPPLFSDLRDAARDGPIIILIASKSSCNAIIVLHQQSPVSIQLATDLAKLRQQVIRLLDTVQGASETRGRLVEVLRELWDDIVCPVVKHLRRLGFDQPYSRIWWCPTSFFNFLPLHAAGEYRQSGKNLSNLYISSYTPSLTALIRARRSRDRSQTVSFAAIGQNRPAGATFTLQSVESELDLVQKLVPSVSNVSFTKVTSVESTKSVALRTLRDNHWLHLACHGTQNFMEPFNSAFLMRDEPLTLLDITQTDLSRHEFAFLSACETAVGDIRTPDEMIHLAAGLQFAGVKSVVGTFWGVEDATVRHLVEAFYKDFCRDGKMNSKRAARALHKAVQSLAMNKDIPLDQRIVFMHIGV
ncbi:hypothetical protein AZE42_10538 [Rhizopogon vesiculosus]|uniref:CHAT domain-containing protein n=1 Tax=Rhizopogon vesiculosus TaxID=180088 RepID=A0A1J8QI81_9AGAM|nr:hypothetical protein AZE42_10538 [Rhizopogon vesiculosus]